MNILIFNFFYVFYMFRIFRKMVVYTVMVWYILRASVYAI